MSGPRWLERHTQELTDAIAALRADIGMVESWGERLAYQLCQGSRLLAAGNGGSAAEAQHLTSELVGRYVDERRPLSALALHAETSSVTAIMNDYGAEEVFARQVRAHGRPGDVLVLLSTSGRSPNLLRAAEQAPQLGLTVWAMTGRRPNPLAEAAHETLAIDAETTSVIQELHLVAVHALCAAVDAALPGAGVPAPRHEDRPGRHTVNRATSRDPLPGHGPQPSPARSVRRRIVVVGDVLLDRDVHGRTERMCPDAPVPVVDVDSVQDSPGGAGLTALLCAASGADVTLIAPVADDEFGARLTALLQPQVAVLPLGHRGPTRRKTRVRSAGQSLLRVDDGGPGTPVDVPLDVISDVLSEAAVVLVSDYGGGTTEHAGLRDVLAEAAKRTALVWDPHPRGGAPVPGAALVTPNLAEARGAAPEGVLAGGHPDQTATALCERWRAHAVCVTAGAQGAYLALSGSEPMFVPAPAVDGGDPCGAGDRFAATAAVALAGGAVLSEAVIVAVSDASAWVAAGGARTFRRASQALPALAPDRAAADDRARSVGEVVAEARARGATVVATGGCFDILHAGHVACLEAARRLGDVLVVLINSDESVRRLKGPGRPAVGVADRARVLQALSCVDAVGIFAEDDPRAALSRLRPDVWAKGGDYGAAPLPEADLVRSWGGRVVLLPYVSGRSTTAILEREAGQEPAERGAR